MSDIATLLLVVVGVPLFLWGTLLLVARLSGWRRMAERFATDEPPAPDAVRFRWQTGYVGWARYKDRLDVAVQPDGLRLSVFAAFRAGYPPLLIPYSEIAAVERKSRVLFSVYQLTVGEPRVGRVTLPERVMEAAREALPTMASPAGGVDR